MSSSASSAFQAAAWVEIVETGRVVGSIEWRGHAL